MKAHAKKLNFGVGTMSVDFQFPPDAVNPAQHVIQNGDGMIYTWLEPSEEELREIKAQQARMSMGLVPGRH